MKLLEEAEEVVLAESPRELINELADLFEVIDGLLETNNLTKDEILVAQLNKRNERGSFAGRKFVEFSEHPIGSFGEKYCLSNPKKYPEIIDM
jgi:hypothetical protein